MVTANTEAQRTAFTVSVDYRHGTTTGISAADRAATIGALIDPDTSPNDLNRPGHIFPLRYRAVACSSGPGTPRPPSTSAGPPAVAPAGVLCEIVTEDKSEMARLPELERFAKKHDLPLISIADLIRYRRRNEKLVRLVSEARIPAEGGEFRAYVYESVLDGEQHLALVMGDVAGHEDVLVRVHSECLTGDVFGSLRCDCGPQLQGVARLIEEEGRGVLDLPARPRGARHRPRPQDPGLPAAGGGARHRRRQPAAGAAGGQPGVRHRRPDAGRPRRDHHAPHDEQPGQVRRPRGLRPRHHRAHPAAADANPENIAYLRTKRSAWGHMLHGLDDVEVAVDGLQRVALDTGVPVVFGVLTTDTVAQAKERAVADKTNKGYEAAQ
jgi:3,4-dihydroxy 2-butanone 4-phosphate synthase/GTP cyclohydrolase II